MSVTDLIESGIVELYCLGIASEEEKLLVEQLAADSPELQKEISSIHEALALFAVEGSKLNPPAELKEKILSSLGDQTTATKQLILPPALTAQSEVDAWLEYLSQHNMVIPTTDFELIITDLPGTAAYFTYVVFGNPGAAVPEEIHDGHHEYLLICKGECEMTMAGQKSRYKAGDFLTITPGTRHTGLVTGTETMIAIGQRRAA